MTAPTADRTMLKFDYEEVSLKKVTAVLGRRSNVPWDEIAIVLDDCSVVLRVGLDIDEITVYREELLSPGPDWEPVDELQDTVGLDLGWCWMGWNFHGYFDMFTVAFTDGENCSVIRPRISFVGEGSYVSIYRLSET